MSKEINNTTIICPLFKKHQEALISKKNSIKNSVRPIEKIIFAEEISETADQMLECTKYDKLQLDCSSCHTIAETQKKIAQAQFTAKKSA